MLLSILCLQEVYVKLQQAISSKQTGEYTRLAALYQTIFVLVLQLDP